MNEDSRFLLAWVLLSGESVCDARDGAEFRRVYNEWIAACRPERIVKFIHERANIGPLPASDEQLHKGG